MKKITAKKIIPMLVAGFMILQTFSGVTVHADDEIEYQGELRINNDTELLLVCGKDKYTINTWSDAEDDDTNDLITYYEDTGMGFSGSGRNPLHIILPDDDARYTLRTLSGEAEDLDFNLKYDDKYILVKASALKAKFSHGGSLKIKDSTEDLDLVIVDDNIPNDQFNTYTISGTYSGDISIRVTEDGAKIKGTDLKGLTVTSEDGWGRLKNDVYEIEDSISGLTIYRDGNEVVYEETEIKQKSTQKKE